MGCLGQLISGLGLGAMLLFFGAGLVLHRATVHTLAAFSHVRVQFAPFLSSVTGAIRPSTVMTWWKFVFCAFAPRFFLFAVSSVIFGALLIEMRGLGVIPFPRLTSGALRPDGSFETYLGASILLSGPPSQCGSPLALGSSCCPHPSTLSEQSCGYASDHYRRSCTSLRHPSASSTTALRASTTLPDGSTPLRWSQPE